MQDIPKNKRFVRHCRTNEYTSFPHIVFPEIMYYGANLGYFPPEARDWIMNAQFPKEKMEKSYMLNPSLKVWWSENNNRIYMEASYIAAKGYGGAGKCKIWGQNARFQGSSEIFKRYGEYAYYHTLRFRYEHKLDVERQLKNDSAFAEVVAFAKQLGAEIEYDWANFNAYKGPVKPTSGKRYASCAGYANEVMEKVLELQSVESVERWISFDHAWNVLNLTDGRTLYFDLTWFDNESINEETGEIYETDDYGWENITFDKRLFQFSNVGYGSRVFHHNMGKFDSKITKD